MNTMIFQNKTAKKLFLTWWTGGEKNFLKYSRNETYFFFWIKKKCRVVWMALHCQLTRKRKSNFLCVFYVYRHFGKENKNVDWAKHRATLRVVNNTVSQYSHFHYHWIDLSAENSFRFAYIVWLAKMWKM